MEKRLRLSDDEKWHIFMSMVDLYNNEVRLYGEEGAKQSRMVASKLAVNLASMGYHGPILDQWMKRWEPAHRMARKRYRDARAAQPPPAAPKPAGTSSPAPGGGWVRPTKPGR